VVTSGERDTVTDTPEPPLGRLGREAWDDALAGMLDGVLNCTFDGIVTIDRHGRILTFNRAASDIFGHAVSDVLGQPVSILMPEPQRSAHARHVQDYLQTGHGRIIGVGREFTGQRKNGEHFPMFLRVSHIRQGDEDLFVGVIKDLSVEVEARTLQSEAMHDSLTRLPNRRYLRERLRQIVGSSKRSTRHVAALSIDIDQFAHLNATRGHDVGDLLLVEVARRLSEHVRVNDAVARISGDEFVVVLDDLSSNAEQAALQARHIAEKLRQTLNTPMHLDGHDYYCRVSIGIGVLHAQLEHADDLLKHADRARSEAKRAGHNAIRFFDPAVHAAIQARLALEADLERALPEQQLRLYLQKQVDHQGRPIGAEALIRWVHPEKGLISPAQFIPIAEETGLIVDIGLWVIETACRQLQAWTDCPVARDFHLAVNVSARQFRELDFVERVRAIVESVVIDPAKLELELTESLVLSNLADTVAKVEEIRGLGVRFSMDDFGTGHSSLTHLTRLPLDQLKIDQSFVANIAAAATDAIVVQTIIGMANSLGLDVIAEGVETEAQRAFLELNGCKKFQGYLFGRPVPISEFEQELDQLKEISL
jgi:diguanylate cyclase (GGDEF)-like protein/PAS domain S-box-containing protein